MKYEVLKIGEGEYEGELRCYEHEEFTEMPVESRRAILVIPGGAYVYCSDRESEPIALEFFNRGYNSYALKYPCVPARYPAQLVVAAAAMDIIRKRAPECKTDPKRVFALGGSAGGHLCACLANCPPDLPAVKKFDFKPNGVVLSYAVINEKFGHPDSHKALLGEERKPDTAWLNLDESVRPDNPPAFIWTTADDAVVPAINSISYATAYNKLKLKYELHVYEHGFHGLSLADDRTCQIYGEGEGINPKVATWVDFADKLLRKI